MSGRGGDVKHAKHSAWAKDRWCAERVVAMKPQLLLVVGSVLLGSSLQVVACSSRFSSCSETRSCPPGSAGNSNGGSSGAGNEDAGRGGDVSDAIPPSMGVAGAEEAAGAAGAAGAVGAAGAAGAAGAEAVGCGDGETDPGEECDQGTANDANAYGAGRCTNKCKIAPFCGDGFRNGIEKCDNAASGVTDLGACNPECTGYYEKKRILPTSSIFPTNLGGIAGADAKCAAQFGLGWKALLVGGTRRATVTPFLGDQPLDWVLQKYRYYYNWSNELIWRTDDVPLLGVHDGKRENIYASLFTGGNFPWAGFNVDWTTFDDSLSASTNQGTCNGWTSVSDTADGSFILADLSLSASEQCGGSSFILCAEQ